MAINFNIDYDLTAPVTTIELSNISSEKVDEDLGFILDNSLKTGQNDENEQLSLLLGSNEYNERVRDLSNIDEKAKPVNIKKQDVKFLRISKKRAFSLYTFLQNKKTSDQIDKTIFSNAKASRIRKVRKYTKEMQNRDAIKESSGDMQKQADETINILDNVFAESAKKPNRKFDDIIYHSPTDEIAEDRVFDAFYDISDMND